MMVLSQESSAGSTQVVLVKSWMDLTPAFFGQLGYCGTLQNLWSGEVGPGVKRPGRSLQELEGMDT